MSAPKVGEAVRTAMKNQTDFYCCKFCKRWYGWSYWVYEAAIKAVEAVDYELGLILEEAKKRTII